MTIPCLIGNLSVAVNSAEIKWKHQGKELVIDNVRITETSKSELVVKDLKYDDSGVYSCFNGSAQLGSTTLLVEGL